MKKILLPLLILGTLVSAFPRYSSSNHSYYHSHTNYVNPEDSHVYKALINLSTLSSKITCTTDELAGTKGIVHNKPATVTNHPSQLELEQNFFYGSNFWSGDGIQLSLKLTCHIEKNDDTTQPLGYITVNIHRNVSWSFAKPLETKVTECSTPCQLNVSANGHKDGGRWFGNQKAQVNILISKK
jgi:hypothetical protein